MMTRKNFLIGSMSVAALGARQLFAATPGSILGTPKLKLGVLSDIHIRNEAGQAVFIKALEWYRDKGVDAVLIAGDMADTGLIAELKLVSDAWYKVFPNNKAPDGRPVEKIFEYGNHCVCDWKKGSFKDDDERKKNMIMYDPKSSWENAFHEAYSPIYSKVVKGYTFVGTHWTGLAQRKEWFDAHAKELPLDMPFFYFQHSHPKDTCYGSWAWGHDDGTATKLLSPFSNAIALSGHSHYTLTDERSVWQGAFTSINTSSLSYSSRDYSYRENMDGNYFGAKEMRKHQMKSLATGDGKQGMLFTICDDHIRIERHEFVWDQSLGDDWILPVGKGAAKPFEYAKRKAARVAPEFAKDAIVKVALLEPEKKEGEEAKEVVATHLNVTFPEAETRDNCRVFEYEVQAVAMVDDIEIAVATRRVLATDFYRPKSKTGRDGACAFALSELPKNTQIRFDVAPFECFGIRGKTISSTPFTTPA